MIVRYVEIDTAPRITMIMIPTTSNPRRLNMSHHPISRFLLVETLPIDISFKPAGRFRDSCRSEPRTFDYGVGGSNDDIEHVCEFRRQLCRSVPFLREAPGRTDRNDDEA